MYLIYFFSAQHTLFLKKHKIENRPALNSQYPLQSSI